MCIDRSIQKERKKKEREKEREIERKKERERGRKRDDDIVEKKAYKLPISKQQHQSSSLFDITFISFVPNNLQY